MGRGSLRGRVRARRARTHLTYAEHARHGFFELVTVAALVLPLLLLADWAGRRDPVRPDRLFRVLAGAPNLDLPYLMQLSDDARPEFVKALPTLDPRLRDRFAFELEYRQRSNQDWRTWNVSRVRARQALENLP